MASQLPTGSVRGKRVIGPVHRSFVQERNSGTNWLWQPLDDRAFRQISSSKFGHKFWCRSTALSANLFAWICSQIFCEIFRKNLSHFLTHFNEPFSVSNGVRKSVSITSCCKLIFATDSHSFSHSLSLTLFYCTFMCLSHVQFCIKKILW